jgi:hypothetical protein
MSKYFCIIAIVFMVFVGHPFCDEKAVGYVYHDANKNGQRDADEKGIANVGVSNGYNVVLSDEDGAYEISIKENDVIFIIKPYGWHPPLDAREMPQFFYVHKPKGSPTSLNYLGVPPTGPLPESLDFALHPYEESDTFRAIVFGDPQVRNIKEIRYLQRDVLSQLIGKEATFGVSLGDLAFDNLSVYEPLTESMATLGVPWYNVHGNHDMNYDIDGDKFSSETYIRIFGPTDFAYQYGRRFLLFSTMLKSKKGENIEDLLVIDVCSFCVKV